MFVSEVIAAKQGLMVPMNLLLDADNTANELNEQTVDGMTPVKLF
jgi:hypothetical protein